jgi:uncharacterized protein (TIGR00251 family)
MDCVTVFLNRFFRDTCLAENTLPVYIRQDGTDVLLAVHVQPGAKKTAWAGLYGDRVKVRLSAPPVDGRANAALCLWLAAQFGCASRNVSVDSGLMSRVKLVRVSGALAADVAASVATQI